MTLLSRVGEGYLRPYRAPSGHSVRHLVSCPLEPRPATLQEHTMTTTTADRLTPGDLLTQSGERVVSRTLQGVTIPAGKVEVVLARGDRVRVAYYRRATSITVERAS